LLSRTVKYTETRSTVFLTMLSWRDASCAKPVPNKPMVRAEKVRTRRDTAIARRMGHSLKEGLGDWMQPYRRELAKVFHIVELFEFWPFAVQSMSRTVATDPDAHASASTRIRHQVVCRVTRCGVCLFHPLRNVCNLLHLDLA